MGAGDEMGLARRLESFGVDLTGIDENDALALRRLMLGIPALAAAASVAPGHVDAILRRLPLSPDDPPLNLAPPSISRADGGAPVVGATVTLHLGEWSGPPPLGLSGVLRRDATPVIEDMTADQAYVLAAEDVGAILTLHVTATNGDEWRLAESAGYGPVVAATALAGTAHSEGAADGNRKRRARHDPRDV